jgi:4-amino-4-deoxy-L-arabinose transferase-like glycosyltransferase
LRNEAIEQARMINKELAEQRPAFTQFAMRHAPLLLITLLGILIRCWRIEDQSVWRDEYLIIGYFRATDFAGFLSAWRFWNADNTPLYPVLAYLVYHLGSATTLAVRLFSVCLSSAAIPLLYLLAARMGGRTAALWACAFLAVSPHHVWYAQAIRPYALLEPLALLSWWTMLEGVRTRKPGWWLANGTLNLALLWTHPFTAFMLAAEVMFLSLTGWGRWRFLMAWGTWHAAGAVSVALWLWSNREYVLESAVDHYRLPDAGKVLFDLLGDDAVMRTNEFWFPLLHGPVLWFTSAERFLTFQGLFDVGMVLVSVAALVGGAMLWRCIEMRQNLTWLLLVYLLPIALLLGLSLAWRPLFEARYTTYSSFALYVLLGLLLSRLRNPAMRAALGTMVLVLMGYQIAALLSGGTRPDWNGVAHQIRTDKAPGDLVLSTFGAGCDDELLAYALGVGLDEVAVAYSPREAMLEVETYFNDITLKGMREEKQAWVAVQDIATPLSNTGSLLPFLSQALYEVEMTTYPGSSPISLYLIKVRETSYSLTYPPLPQGGVAPLVYPAAESLGMALDPARTEALLANIFEHPIPDSKVHYFLLAMALFEEGGDAELGRAAAEAACQLAGDYPPALFARAVGRALAGEREEAWKEFNSALALDRVWIPLYAPLMRAALQERDAVRVGAELERLKPVGFPYRALHNMCRPMLPIATQPL